MLNNIESIKLSSIALIPSLQAETRGESFGVPVKDTKLFISMFGGWDAAQGLVSVIPWDEKYRPAYESDRQRLLAQFTATDVEVEVDGAVHRYTGGTQSAKAAQLMPDNPAWIGITGNRRRYVCAYLGADMEIPCKVLTDTSEDALERERMVENADTGKKSHTDAELCVAGIKRLNRDLTLRESGLMQYLNVSRGTAQKFYALGQLAVRFPELEIARRIRLAAKDEKDQPVPYKPKGYLPLSKMDKEHLRDLRDGVDMNPKNPAIVPKPKATAEEVEAYFATLWEAGNRKSGAVDKAGMLTIAKSQAGPTATLMEALAAGDSEKVSETLNKIRTSAAEMALNAVTPAVKELLKQLRDLLGKDDDESSLTAAIAGIKKSRSAKASK